MGKVISRNGACQVIEWPIPPHIGGKPMANNGLNELNDHAHPAQGVHATTR